MTIRLFILQRICLIGLFLLFAPASSQALSLGEARHLLARTSFGGTPREIKALMPLSRGQAVDQLLAGVHREAVTTPPDWVEKTPPGIGKHGKRSQRQTKALRRKRRQQALSLQSWWFREMLATPSPLTERMTLFWHNHFTSSMQKVKFPRLLYRQNLLLRRLALGNFGTLLHAVSRDPAMVIYLDNHRNHKKHPNENYARELLELFTLGEGHYSEADIKAAARAFTGWSVNRKTGAFRLRSRQHDFGIKHFMVRDGHFDGDAILDIILANPQVARLITTKLWKEMISPDPEPEAVEQLARIFSESGLDIKSLVRAVLRSPHFWAKKNRGVLIKSPVTLLVGTVRLLHIEVKQPEALALISRRLGQELFNPPSVKGWPGGRQWITTATLADRRTLVRKILSEKPDKRIADALVRPDKNQLRQHFGAAYAPQIVREIVLPIEPLHPLPKQAPLAKCLAILLKDPVYQLE